jgi:hypothetical protein
VQVRSTQNSPLFIKTHTHIIDLYLIYAQATATKRKNLLLMPLNSADKMIILSKKFICLLSAVFLINTCSFAQHLIRYVDPMIGTGGHGHTY